MKKRVILLASLIFIVFTSYADSFKFGYVDLGKIFTTAKPSVKIQEELQNKFMPTQKSLQAMNDKLVDQQKTIYDIEKKTPDFNKLSKPEKTKLQTLAQKFQQDQMKFQQEYMIFQQNSGRIQEYASSLVLEKINLILKSISDKGHYDLVLTSNQFAYAKSKFDLTDQVIEQLNKIDVNLLIKKINEEAKKPVNGIPTLENLPKKSV